MGVPVVFPSKTPERISTVSDSQIEGTLHVSLAQRQARRAAVDDATETGTMGFPECRHSEKFAESVGRHAFPL